MDTIPKKLSILFAISLLFVSAVFAGPFGIEMGMTLEQLKLIGVNPVPIRDANGRYRITPKKQHSDFNFYAVDISPNYGVYVILAISKDIPISSSGIELRNKCYEIQKSLSNIYGSNQTFDSFQSSSILDKDSDWTIKNEVIIFDSFWMRKYNSNLPNDLSSIWLEAIIDSTSGYLRLQYESINADKAYAEQEAQNNSVF